VCECVCMRVYVYVCAHVDDRYGCVFNVLRGTERQWAISGVTTRIPRGSIKFHLAEFSVALMWYTYPFV
jgi:hypothetical protein